ncbi:MAG: hypothetical protein ACR2JI_10775 [Mycobacterium sp.]
MVEAFIASEALAAGAITRYELVADHRRVLPNVHAPRGTQLSLDERIAAAWLWSGRVGVITGLAAAALHGAKWVDPDIPIELNHPHNKSPSGVITRRDTLLRGEVTRVRRMPLTTVERTAFDLARRGPAGKAVAYLDALFRARHFSADDVLAIVGAHPRVRGRRRVSRLLDLVDGGAQSPKETWLRLVLIDAGFPRPQTQIPVRTPDGYPRYYLDMGWEEFMVAVEYDGEQHRTDSAQYRGDIARSEYIDGCGWRRIRVLHGHRREDIIDRVAAAGVPRYRR